MADRVRGWVNRVLDGDTFQIDVDWEAPRNGYNYNDIERVRLFGVNAPELREWGGLAAKSRLQREIQGRRVELTVHTRDVYRRLIADVRVVR